MEHLGRLHHHLLPHGPHIPAGSSLPQWVKECPEQPALALLIEHNGNEFLRGSGFPGRERSVALRSLTLSVPGGPDVRADVTGKLVGWETSHQFPLAIE